jgi:hypothetical protein
LVSAPLHSHPIFLSCLVTFCLSFPISSVERPEFWQSHSRKNGGNEKQIEARQPQLMKKMQQQRQAMKERKHRHSALAARSELWDGRDSKFDGKEYEEKGPKGRG